MASPFITERPNQVIRSVKIHNTGQEVPVEGEINFKTRGGYLYLLWSKKVPAQQYLGSSAREPRRRFAIAIDEYNLVEAGVNRILY